ncbi:peptidase [Nocardiopsis sp. CNR-923]|uniref:transglycosylase domain-containing protein n=1 Tax=Nocardiopsis sp. CNR-923 TaxID=1904965 RepID=UPI00095CC41B|nr:transglycosylase domain-containing protein [Nocardiopsis sp. CNR-923]OLT26750.1 peptidase [Nocardiopsis sp. CNR-923]
MRAGRPRALARLLGVSVLAGVLAAALVLPWVGAVGVLGRDTAALFMAMPADLKVPHLSERVVLTDVEGRPFGEIAEREREVVSLDEVSPWVPAALLAVEDDRFHEHHGFDPRGVLRAAVLTVLGDTQGGSTLTQQYVKNLLIESADTEEEAARASERSLARKLVELRYAVGLERRLSKDEILEGYLNLAYFGAGAHGIEIAARRYFSAPAADLDPGQAATLVGLVRAPSYYDPLTNPEAARERRDLVLERMVAVGRISRAEADGYLDRGLGLAPTPRGGSCYHSEYPFFCDYVTRWLLRADVLGDTEEERLAAMRQGGITVRTTLDPRVQAAAQEAVDRHVPSDGSTRFAAEAVVEPGTGQVRALAQNLRYGFDEADPGTTAINLAVDRRDGGTTGYQAGSTFKTFTLAAALDAGIGYGTSFRSPGTISISGLRNCDGGRMEPWDVRNVGESSSGPHTMVSATRGSVNTYFAQLQRKVGLCETATMAERAGVHRADGEPLGVWSSFTLGDQEVSPLTLAAAYATFAARGVHCVPVPVTAVATGDGREDVAVEAECERRVEQRVADGVNHLLQEPFDGGTANGLGIGRPAAGKTGTTDGAAYAWFAGYTPNLAAAVAVGDVRGGERHPLQNVTIGGRYYGIVYGGTLPGPIWRDTMSGATASLPAEGFAGSPTAFGDPDAESPDGEDDGGGGDSGPARGPIFPTMARPLGTLSPRGTSETLSPRRTLGRSRTAGKRETLGAPRRPRAVRVAPVTPAT